MSIFPANDVAINRDPDITTADAACSFSILILVFISRYFTRAALYYVDGPRMVRAIQDHSFVIQAPGYWLYAHLGGLFRDPAFGLSMVNIFFSGAGACIFFLLCRRFNVSVQTSLIATFAYSSIFYLWFAGDVHSSYASQILFAPLTVYSFLCYNQKPSTARLAMCGASFAIGAGLRPSDGAFLSLLFIFLIFQFVRQPKDRIILIVFTGMLCLAWYIPTEIALHAARRTNVKIQLSSLAFQVSPLLVGLNARTAANILRVVLPLIAAFWMLIPSLLSPRKSIENWMLALWVLPGFCFFTLIYMADATYLTFLSGAIILASALSDKKRYASALLVVCFLFNSSLFLWARPIRSTALTAQAINFYVVKYCYYGIRYQWSSTIKSNSAQPPASVGGGSK